MLGYHDGIQLEGLFWYTGEGQVGDMLWVRGNRAIRDHQKDGKTLHLFEQARRGRVRYISAAEYLGHHIAVAPDKNGDPRKAIVFELGLLGDQSTVTDRSTSTDASEKALKSLPMSELRTAALASAHSGASPEERKAAVYRRSETIKLYVRKRANGKCEACLAPAPFLTDKGEPYLEPHHIRRLADGRPDHPRWVAAICPNCHRQVHHGMDGKELNAKIKVRLGEIEACD